MKNSTHLYWLTSFLTFGSGGSLQENNQVLAIFLGASAVLCLVGSFICSAIEDKK